MHVYNIQYEMVAVKWYIYIYILTDILRVPGGKYFKSCSYLTTPTYIDSLKVISNTLKHRPSQYYHHGAAHNTTGEIHSNLPLVVL